MIQTADIVLHSRSEGVEMIARKLPQNEKYLSVQLRIALDNGEPVPVMWQTLPKAQAENLIALLMIAVPKWSEVIVAERARVACPPGF
jgi:hypothetical protein